MRIAIDCRMYSQSGIGRYIRNLINQLQFLDKENQYYLLHLKIEYESGNYYHNFKKVLADFKWYGISEQIKMPKLINDLNPDLVHFPHFNVPIFYNGKFVVTIHDLIHQHYQMRRATTHDPITYKVKQMGYKAVFKNAIAKSQKILVPSNYIKDLLIREWVVSAEKITITHEAVDDRILTLTQNSKLKTQNLLKKFNIKSSYIFYVGNAHPHKNVEGLIKAFLFLRKNYQYLQLVLSGQDHYFWQRIKKDHQHEDIIYTGQVSDEQLVALYKNATCFVIPSFEEGFGIPILEAMVCECPVVSSNGGALPEVGGEAALYFDPSRIEDMQNKIERILKSEKLRVDLIKKGSIRVKLFSWERLARQTQEVYEQCV